MIGCERKSVDPIESILRTGDFFRSIYSYKVVFSVLIIGWVKPHDTLRPRSPLSLRAQGHRKEWLPPSWVSGTLSQSPVQTINLALRWVIGFTRWDQSDTVCSVSVCPSVRRLAPVLPTFRAPSLLLLRPLRTSFSFTGISAWCLIIFSSYFLYMTSVIVK